MNVKQCRYCNQDKPIEQFSVAKKKGDKIYRRHRCHDCKVKQQTQRLKEIAAWFQAFKKTQKCVQCGNDDFRVLHFDHLGDKEFNLGSISTRGISKARIIKEISKCQVLCANCHAIKTFEERQDGR